MALLLETAGWQTNPGFLNVDLFELVCSIATIGSSTSVEEKIIIDNRKPII
jgi:hypothetical protein